MTANLATTLAGCADPVGSDAGRDYLWRVPLPTFQAWSGIPALAGDRLFVELTGELVAMDANTGAIEWRRRISPREASLATNIVLHDERVFVADESGIFAFEQSSGDTVWHDQAPASASGSENLADDSSLYVGLRNGEVMSLGLADGDLRWRYQLWPGWPSLRTIQGISRGGDTLYVAGERWMTESGYLRGGTVVALDRAAGRELWRYDTPTRNGGFDAAPSITDRLLLLADREDGSFFALDRFTGREVWRTETEPGFAGPNMAPVVVGHIAYAASNDGYAYALRVSDGAVLWRTFTGASASHVAVCGNIVLTQSQGTVSLHRLTGRLLRTRFAGEDDLTVSGFAVSVGRAWATGTEAVYAFRC